MSKPGIAETIVRVFICLVVMTMWMAVITLGIEEHPFLCVMNGIGAALVTMELLVRLES